MSLHPKIKSNDFIELCLLLPCCRTTLDLGIVKKSIVVDDVSNWWGSQSRVCAAHALLTTAVSTVVHFERHRVRTASFQTGVVVPAAQHRAAGAGLRNPEHIPPRPGCSHSNILLFLSQILKRKETITSKASDPPSSAILVVYLDKAEELPVSHTSTRRAHIRAPLSAAFCLWLSRAIALNNTCLPIRKTVALAPCPFVPFGG